MHLSKNFTLAELCTTGGRSILNQPNAEQTEALRRLCIKVLQPIREHFGLPVTVNSGFRCLELNAAVGGSPTSQHMRGEAADIEIAGVRNDEIWNFIVAYLNYDQAIAERLSKDDGAAGWIHVSFAAKNRKQALSSPTPGKYVKGLVYGN
jgi:hypothetical protein